MLEGRTTPELIALMLCGIVCAAILGAIVQGILRGPLPEDSRSYIKEVILYILGVLSGILGNKQTTPPTK